jgi:endonuclease III
LLIATILSAQTTDKKVNEVTFKLFQKYRNIDDYIQADLKQFEKDIYGVNYHKTKAKAIIENAKIVKNRFHSKIPKTMEELLFFKGVARKTANVVLSAGFGINEGIAVDTHVKRLAILHGLTKEEDPKKIEKDLLKIIPEKEREDVQLRLVQYGRDYCPAKKHDHKNCPLVLALNNKK